MTAVRRNRIVRHVQARPRLFIAALAAVALGLALPAGLVRHELTRWLVAWNAGTMLYVALATVMMLRSSEHRMRRRAALQDEGRITILVLVVIAAVASLAAIAGQLALVKDEHGLRRWAHVGLAGLTVFSSWAFIQVMFALHYAHDWYAALVAGRPPGLRFPDQDTLPGYGDFFYVAAVIGTSGQTADVCFASREARRIGSVHCILAYLFNTTVLALLINIGASLL